MAIINASTNPTHTVGELPAVGQQAPAFTLVGADMEDITLYQFRGRTVILNIFLSLDTRVCALSVHRFNQLAAGLANTVVVSVSKDLPFAMSRFCVNEGIDNVISASAFRSTFGEDYGVTMLDGRNKGLLARAIVVIDKDGLVVHAQLVPETRSEPNYDAAIAALH